MDRRRVSIACQFRWLQRVEPRFARLLVLILGDEPAKNGRRWIVEVIE